MGSEVKVAAMAMDGDDCISYLFSQEWKALCNLPSPRVLECKRFHL